MTRRLQQRWAQPFAKPRCALRRVAALLLFAAVLAASGCATQSPPARLGLSVLQYRSDYAVRQLQLQVTNRGREDIVVTAARFRSAYFAREVEAITDPYTVRAGVTTDFPVTLPEGACASGAADPQMTVEYRQEDGSRHTVRTAPSDPVGSLAVLHAADCSRQAFERVARIAFAPVLRFTEDGGHPVALLDVTFTPTGAPGAVTLDSVQSTILLQQPEGELRAIARTFSSANPATTITLAFTPTRCDQHVVAEDKIGTLIPFRVDADAFVDALFTVPVSNEVKAQFYDFVGRSCGWSTG